MKPRSLGSKGRSFMPMTPRNVKSSSETRNDFAKQVSEHTRCEDGQPPQKKFRSSAAPKGSRLAAGYTDRAQQRGQEDEDDKQTRLKNLEKMLKLQQIDQNTFDALREEIGIGGDTSSTHLVKGLDFKLLERVRRGEDVTQGAEVEEKAVPEEPEPEIDVEDELEQALQKEVDARQRGEEEEALGEIENNATTSALSRDEILRQLKERRKNPNSAQQGQTPVAAPSLDHARFKKLDPVKKSNKHKFTESVNGRRREVLVITNKDGTTKRKTRWLDPEVVEGSVKNGDKVAGQAWGGDLDAEVLARQKAEADRLAQQEAAKDEDDIFGGVDDYDPLAEIESGDEDAQEAASVETQEKDDKPDQREKSAGPLQSTMNRNYFAATNREDEAENAQVPTHDPAILAALKRAAQIRREEEEAKEDSSSNGEEQANGSTEDEARRKALLKKLQQQSGQDDVDLDMTFDGSGRVEDEDDSRRKLSEWKGIGVEDDDDDDQGQEKNKQKRDGKKRKGDKNSFADVVNVIEGRKKT